MSALKLSDVHCARWSGENTPKPAITREGFPVPLTYDQAEDLLVEAVAEIGRLRAELDWHKQQLESQTASQKIETRTIAAAERQKGKL